MFDGIVIGASAGGISTCVCLLNRLPVNFLWPILIVQHLHPTQDSSIVAKIIGVNTKLVVKEAEDLENICKGFVYIAPADRHMVVTQRKTLFLFYGEKVKYCRPSIDVLFKSASSVFGKRVVGIILTGANEDGAQGLADIKNHGGYTIVQDPDTAEISFMPKHALEKTAADTILSPEAIGIFLAEMASVYGKMKEVVC